MYIYIYSILVNVCGMRHICMYVCIYVCICIYIEREYFSEALDQWFRLGVEGLERG
jgi:hypothetical protein